MSNLRRIFSIAPASSFPAGPDGGYRRHSITSRFDASFFSSSAAAPTACHGFWHNAALVLPSALFIVYLGFQAMRNVKKLRKGRSRVMIAYYFLLWVSAVLNLSWSSLQAWECAPEKGFAWNLLSLSTASGMLFLEISIVVFLLQENYVSGLETLPHTFLVSGLCVGVDMLLKLVCIFGFGVPVFADLETVHKGKWGILFIYNLLLSAFYGYILFVHFSNWRDKLPPKPAFYNYVIVLFAFNVVASCACWLVTVVTGFGLWLYNLTVVCYHSLYLPFLYVTFLADFFQEDDWLLDNAYYSEMKDAGFFDSDLD